MFPRPLFHQRFVNWLRRRLKKNLLFPSWCAGFIKLFAVLGVHLFEEIELLRLPVCLCALLKCCNVGRWIIYGGGLFFSLRKGAKFVNQHGKKNVASVGSLWSGLRDAKYFLTRKVGARKWPLRASRLRTISGEIEFERQASIFIRYTLKRSTDRSTISWIIVCTSSQLLHRLPVVLETGGIMPKQGTSEMHYTYVRRYSSWSDSRTLQSYLFL